MPNIQLFTTLQYLGDALYRHTALIKRAEEAKLALENTMLVDALKKTKKIISTIKKTYDNTCNNSAPTNKVRVKCTR